MVFSVNASLAAVKASKEKLFQFGIFNWKGAVGPG